MIINQNDNIQVYRIPVRPQYKRRRKPKRKNNFPKFILFIALIIFATFYFINNQDAINLASKTKSGHSALDLKFNFSPRRQNILLMGVDVATNSKDPFKGNRSDTMLLISVAPYGKNVNVISIPRDSKVYVAGKNKTDKINHAFAFGGARLAVRTVEETFGVKINNYIAISNHGVIKMIDILGGLPIYIEKNMKYDDYSANLHINLKQGQQVLNGTQTEGYLRFRHDSFGDIGRIRRQQWFFNALISRVKEPTAIVKLPELLKVLPEYIQTDFSAYDLAKYVSMAKNIDPTSIQVATIPGAPSTKGFISYWIIDPEKTQDLINKMVYRNKSNIAVKDLAVGILYDANKETTANSLKAILEAKGYETKLRSAEGLSKNYIAVHNFDITNDVMSDFKKELPEIKNLQTIYDPIGINRTGKDLTIVLAN